MDVSPEETLAALRVLVAMARADGVLHDKQRETLETVLADWTPPEGVALDKTLVLGTLWNESVDLDAVLSTFETKEAREHVYGAAHAIAVVDGECSPEEQALLDRLRRAFSISGDRQRFLERVLGPGVRVVVRHKPSDGPAPFEEIARKSQIDNAIREASIASAVLGSFPFPIVSIATELAVVGIQIGLAGNIALAWGRAMDPREIRGLLAAFGTGTGLRIAITNLLKVFPGWGSVAGAAAAYASTHAVGRVVNHYFERGQPDPTSLRSEFERVRKEGKDAFADDRTEVERRAEATHETVAELAHQLETGAITREEFDECVAAVP
jgi:uncharacterized protein (DUF697 family)/uncharacterized tellurite resistance protein B-like protein